MKRVLGTPHRRRCCALPLALLFMAASASALALQDDAEQPLYLEADNAELDELKSVSIYTGDVFVQQGSMQIRADQVTVYHGEDRQPERIIATGEPATYRQEMEGDEKEVRAEARRMEYVTETDEIRLIDEAIVYQGQDTFRNDRILYDRANAKVKAGTSVQGKQRVKILIHPSQR
jgi:lipopolysaccharide export system protein LptA